MEATYGSALHFPSRIGRDKTRSGISYCSEFNRGCQIKGRMWENHSAYLRSVRLSLQQGRIPNAVPLFQPENFCASLDGNWLLKEKGQEISLSLNGRSVFLVGMMGSGKTTVGKILSESLNYSFVDSDKYVEQVLGDISVAQIFQQYGENFFRDSEIGRLHQRGVAQLSEALQKLSIQPGLVVATGGGAVVRPTNWKYMKHGITVFLDVPLDALARRIASVGTDSRPLLLFDSGDPYTKAFMGLFTLSKKRVEAYLDADVTISLLDLANEMGIEDVSDIRPDAIALEVLVRIQNYLQSNGSRNLPKFP